RKRLSYMTNFLLLVGSMLLLLSSVLSVAAWLGVAASTLKESTKGKRFVPASLLLMLTCYFAVGISTVSKWLWLMLSMTTLTFDWTLLMSMIVIGVLTVLLIVQTVRVKTVNAKVREG